MSSPSPRFRYAWKRKVHWKMSPNYQRPSPGMPAVTATELAQIGPTLDALIALFKATPEGSTGEGFWVNESRNVNTANLYDLPPGTAANRYPLQFSSGLFPFYHEDDQTNDGWRKSVSGETESVYYQFNRLPEQVEQRILVKEKQPGDKRDLEFYTRPEVTGRIGGLPIYDNQILAVARPGRELWAAVPVGRVLRAALPEFEKQKATAENRLAGLKKKLAEVQSPEWEKNFRDYFEKNYGNLKQTRPSGYETRRASMERELVYLRNKALEEASPNRDATGAWYWNPVEAHREAVERLSKLSAADAAKPACFLEYKKSPEKDGRYNIGGQILVAGEAPDCKDLVYTNPAYFDPALPRSAPQVLTVVRFGRCALMKGDTLESRKVTDFRAPPQGCFRHAQMWRELDWARFAALIRP
ncbi:MAG: hypothetical protein FJW32_21715 [Acidobacteria bacterium]|nr:hypothetical protein [Acidobacteriota bacterium]